MKWYEINSLPLPEDESFLGVYCSIRNGKIEREVVVTNLDMEDNGGDYLLTHWMPLPILPTGPLDLSKWA